jgi:hypothetical protein
MKHLSKFTRFTLAIALVLLLYGYLCRAVGINFFWESKSLGWSILLIGLIGLLSDRIKVKAEHDQKTLLEKIGIGLLVFVLLIESILMAVIPFSNAYEAAKRHVKNNEALQTELGPIHGFGIIPTGAISKSSGSSGEYGNAEINLTIKGEKKFRDVVVFVVKTADSPDWKVVSLE